MAKHKNDLHVRFSDVEIKWLKDRAKAMDITVSSLLREIVRGRILQSITQFDPTYDTPGKKEFPPE